MVSNHFLLQEIFPTQGSNPGLLHCRQILYHLSYQGKPYSAVDSYSVDGPVDKLPSPLTPTQGHSPPSTTLLALFRFCRPLQILQPLPFVFLSVTASGEPWREPGGRGGGVQTPNLSGHLWLAVLPSKREEAGFSNHCPSTRLPWRLR